MTQTIDRNYSIASSAIAFGFGVLIGAIVNTLIILKNFSIANEIQIEFDVVGVFSVFVTVIFGYYISRQLSVKDSQERAEKDNLISYFKTFQVEFTTIMKKLAQNEVGLTRVTSVLKRHRMRADKLVKLAERHKFLSSNSKCAEDLDGHIKKIIDLMTETPAKGEVANGVEVRVGLLFFSEKKIDEIVSAIFDIDSDVFDIIVEINRCQR